MSEAEFIASWNACCEHPLAQFSTSKAGGPACSETFTVSVGVVYMSIWTAAYTVPIERRQNSMSVNGRHVGGNENVQTEMSRTNAAIAIDLWRRCNVGYNGDPAEIIDYLNKKKP